MRSSTLLPAFRKLPGDARQRKEALELASEQLPQLLRNSRRRRSPTVIQGGYYTGVSPVRI